MTASHHSFTVSAPGSLMLMGEHAVLHGRSALCMAVEPRLKICVTPRSDREIRVASSVGSLHSSLDTLPDQHELSFVLACIKQLPPGQGFEADIRSDLNPSKGLGTSAAVTVAMTTALQRLQGHPFDPAAIVTSGVHTIREVQGRGSGCDAAASTFGGIVCIDPDPFRVEPIHTSPPFWTAYAGYKTKTPEVIAHVEQLRHESPDTFEHLFDAMGDTVTEAVEAIRKADWETLGRLMTRHHYLQGALGTSNQTLDHMVHLFLKMPHILGAKISGSGLGDSVLALGEADPQPALQDLSPVAVSSQGVRFED